MRTLLPLAVLAMGCGPPRPPAARVSGGAPSTAPRAVVPPAASSVQPSARPPLSLQLVPQPAPPAPSSLPHVEILQPSFGDTVEARFALKQPVRVRADAAWLTAEAEGVLVSLDGGRPRRVLADSAFTLGDLLPLQQTLAEGAHVLLAVAVSADGRAIRVSKDAPRQPLALVEFFVGPRKGDLPSPERALFCLNPVGTHYLKPDQAVPLEVLPFGWLPNSVSLRVRSDSGDFVGSIDPGRAYAVRGLPVGDVTFSVGAEPGPRAECVVTVNREAVTP